MTKNAIITAAAVEVQCPYCGDPQPNPTDGSHLWFPSQVTEGKRTCVACDTEFSVRKQSRVSVAD